MFKLTILFICFAETTTLLLIFCISYANIHLMCKYLFIVQLYLHTNQQSRI